MSVSEIVDLLKANKDGMRKPIMLDGVQPMVFECSFASTGVGAGITTGFSHLDVPAHLRQFWEVTEWAKLYEDMTFGQWGLCIFRPGEAIQETRTYSQQRMPDFVEGDLVIGHFLGDSDLLIVRCDKAVGDFGNMLVVPPLDHREDWYHAGDSFGDFLVNYVESRGDKFWEKSL